MMRMIEKAETTAILYINFTTRKRTINPRKMSASLRRERERKFIRTRMERMFIGTFVFKREREEFVP